jgi:hypothetical protein
VSLGNEKAASTAASMIIQGFVASGINIEAFRLLALCPVLAAVIILADAPAEKNVPCLAPSELLASRGQFRLRV